MSDKLSTINRGIQLTPRQDELCIVLYSFNQLRDYKLADHELVEWMKTFDRLLPGIDPDKVQFAIDRMISGELPYDKNKGIQNIFTALKEINGDDRHGYTLRSNTRW